MSYWNDQSSSDILSSNPYGNYTVVDRAGRDLLPLVDPHWYQFPPMNPLWYGILGFVMIILATLSCVGNAMVVYIFMTTKSLRTPTNMLVVGLAMNDFTMMFCMCPPLIVNCYYQTWAFSPFACEVYGFIGSLCGTNSIAFMVFITADRYNVIVNGMSGKPLTSGGVAIRILLVLLFSIGWVAPPFFGWNRYVPEGNLTACGTDYLTEDFFHQSYLYLFSIFSWLFPLFWIIYCYTYIVKAVFAHEKQMKEQAKKMGVKSLRSEENQKASAEIRLAKVALTNVSLWFIAWTPYLIINTVGMNYKSMITPLFTIWGSVFAKANAVYNPIIYAISHPKYKAALEKKVPCLACKSGDDHQSQSDASSVQTDVGKTENA